MHLLGRSCTASETNKVVRFSAGVIPELEARRVIILNEGVDSAPGLSVGKKHNCGIRHLGVLFWCISSSALATGLLPPLEERNLHGVDLIMQGRPLGRVGVRINRVDR